MKRFALLPLVVLVAAACSDPAMAPASVGGPSLQVAAGSYPGVLDDDNAPSGTHLQRGTIGCTVNADLSVSCSSFQLNGVGNTNADVSLVASYSAIVDCFNPGNPNNQNNPIESHETTFEDEDSFTEVSSRNGRLAVDAASVDTDAAPIGCPNPNWDPRIREGSLTLESFTYTLTFDGFDQPAITISEP